MLRSLWVLHPNSVPSDPPVYSVRAEVVRVVSSGLGNNDLPVEVLVGPSPTGTPNVDFAWVPLIRCGSPVVLNAQHTMHVELIAGYYRLRTDLLPPSVLANAFVRIEWEEGTKDSNAIVLQEVSLRCCRVSP